MGRDCYRADLKQGMAVMVRDCYRVDLKQGTAMIGRDCYRAELKQGRTVRKSNQWLRLLKGRAEIREDREKKHSVEIGT